MKTLKQILRLMLLLAFVLTFVLPSACTEVEICTEDTHPHFAHVNYNFNWSEFIGKQPDSILVIAYRVVNMWKSTMVVDRNTLTGHYLQNPPNEHLDTLTNISKFKLPGGNYKFIAFNESKKEFIYTKIEQFPIDPEMSINELEISYKTYTQKDIQLNKSLPNWVDYNPYSRFIAPNVGPIFYDTIPTRMIRANENSSLDFKMRPITQTIDVYFDVNKIVIDEAGGVHKFTIDEIYGEMSGIPFIINISSGYIDIKRTCKVMFKCNMINADGTAFTDNDDNMKQLHLKGTLSVPTIVQNQSPSIITGPGIMQVIIHCSTDNPNYDPISSPEKRLPKTFQGIINLYNSLDSAKCYGYTKDGLHVVQNGSHKELHIVKPLVVDGLKVLEESEAAGGLDIWKSTLQDSIIVHI